MQHYSISLIDCCWTSDKQ